MPEHGEETEGGVCPQGRTEGPQAGSDGTEVMQQLEKDGKTSKRWHSHGNVSHLELAGHLEGLQGS